MADSKALMAKLKSSLPTPKEAAGPVKPLHDFTAAPQQRAPKLSVSLYRSDLERLDSIREHMLQAGVRTLTDSEAIRLACRRADLDSKMLDIYREMQSEDGRKKAK